MKKSALYLLILSFASTGCAQLAPLIQDFNIISLTEEKQLSTQIEGQIAAEMPIVKGTAANQQIEKIGARLVRSLPQKDFDYRFLIVNDKTPNAFTIPGGAIYVHSGLINFASDENEIAGVIAHEIGHAVERHPTKALSRAYGLEYLSQSLSKGNAGNIRSMALMLLKGGILSKYSRDDEREADEIAFYLLQRSGYPTSGLLKFLKKLILLETGGPPVPFLSTHPPTPERVRRLEILEAQPPVTFPALAAN